ncbi:MAG: class I SAM-dependent methyltransferase [Bacteroidales bacterium]|jgi:ubiquinone/menaquinone biosynthesis C-methylase UbiE|nr:class I SAM-dependent methyltransferase [Bacteroidales bacterium]
MNLKINALIYTALIDPLLSGLRRAVLEAIDPSATVIDIACGPGTLSLAMAQKANHVTGIDLDEKLISYASGTAGKKGIWNVSFALHDASDLSVYHDKKFDIAVTSMAIHQFPEDLAVKVLREMKRIAGKVIIADYNSPMPPGFSRTIAYGIERITKGDHHKNFRKYISRGGIGWFTAAAGLEIRSTIMKGNGVFTVVVCN